MSKEILQSIIKNFDLQRFRRFFSEKNKKFRPSEDNLDYYYDDNFSSGQKLGELYLEDGNLLICAFGVKRELSERSGKKAQYNLGRSILKDNNFQQFNAGIFVFYDQNENFRFSLIYDIPKGIHRDWNNFRRFTYFINKDQTNKTFLQRIGDGDFSSLEKIKDAFSVEKVTKEFYKDIANWYFWAVQNVKFPKDAEAEENGRNIAVIRLITRIIFIWFMRERSLVPKYLFDKKRLNNILKDTSPEKPTYYLAILQNLFFATLNTKNTERNFNSEQGFNKKTNPDYGDYNGYRYYELFKDSTKINEYFGDIPFLNGGLFECLDDKSNGIIVDGFSDNQKNQPLIPNYLFFSGELKADLNIEYGTKNKSYKVQGLIDTLSSYNFTIDENDLDDQEVALDPELLGRVFENLLASFNPETSTTARKATGSYYTPREIVNYMVTESLKQYFKTHLKNIVGLEDKLEELFSKNKEENPFNKGESEQIVKLIELLRIVDPAVGSGAFPMGVLNKLVFILSKIDPQNLYWKKVQIKAVEQNVVDSVVRQKLINQIEKQFQEKNIDYGRKLFLIQKCIYGVDIQQIAVEIARLRFFISLLVNEKIDLEHPDGNCGIQPLPNLDFKIMQGNSLISEFLGIDFDKDNSESAKLFSDNYLIEEIIKDFEKKKSNFQSEQDRNKKEKLKEDIEKLIIKILNLKLEGKFPEFKAIEEKYINFPNVKQRKELIEKEKQRLSKKIGFDIENAQKQLKEYTEGIHAKPFFLWKLYFAEVFQGDNPGFDIVIANPPYIRADDPSIRIQREAVMASKNYQTLWEKWDLYIAFIERGYSLLGQNGILEFIISDAYMSSKYAEKSHSYFLDKAVISRINFCSKLKIFDASVRNIIIEFIKHINPSNIPIRVKHENNWDNFIMLPSKKQSKMDKNTFKIDSENKIIGNLSNTLTWGEICYVSYGLRPSSDERYWKGEFIKNDLISDIRDKIHSKSYVEGKWIKKYFIEKIKYLEWNTERSPKKLVRPTFSELYTPPKIMLGGMTGAIYDENGLYCNHSITVSVLWKDLSNINNRSITGSIKKDFKVKNIYQFRKQLEDNSKKFNLKYLLAILNSKFAFKFLDSIRRSQIGFYPDDLKKLPIKKISIKDQKPFIEIVNRILTLAESNNYLGNPAKNEEVKGYEKQINQMVYKLYDLTLEEIEIVENSSK